MKLIRIAFPLADLRALVEDRQRQLSFNTDETGEPLRVEIAVQEHLPKPGQLPRRRLP